jgi:mannose-6-phosphate isomerase class I
MTKIQEEANELCKEFMALEEVKRYQEVKKVYESDPRLAQLKQNIDDSKKNLKHIPLENKGDEIKRIKKLEADYYNDSEVVTYSNLKKEVEDLFQPIRDLFKF